MRVLLDTHAFLWWVAVSQKLPTHAREIIAGEHNQPVFSVVSAWEIAVKVGVGKLELHNSLEKFVTKQLSPNALDVLPIYIRHALGVQVLPNHHRDPFDRLLITRALAENIATLTADPLVTKYPVQTVW